MLPLQPRRMGLWLCVMGPALAGVPGAAAQSYTVTELTGSGGPEGRAYALNRTGQTVGWFRAEDDSHHGAHWTNEVMDDLQDTSHLSLLLVFNVGYSEAYDISDADQIVGTARKEIQCLGDIIVVTTGFILRPATNTDFGTPFPGDALTDLGTFGNPCAVFNSAATGISNNNHVVGWSDLDGGGHIRAFRVVPQNGVWYVDANGDLVNDLMQNLGTLGGDVSSATAVNDSGRVVGFSYISSNVAAGYHAFLWTQGANDGVPSNPQMRDLGTLGGTNSWARDINNSNQIVGEADTAQGRNRAFLWQNGTMTDLGTLGGDDSSAAAINEKGQIVGWAQTADGRRHAFLWDSGTMTDLNTLVPSGTKLELVEARDINEDGRIVGWGYVKGVDNPETHAFFLQPSSQPPPADSDAGGASGGSVTGGTVVTNPSAVGIPLLGGGSVVTTQTGPDGQPVVVPTLCGLGAAGMVPASLVALFLLRGTGRHLRRG